MRVSVQNSDPGYFEGSYLCAVYLDGEKLDTCVTADEEEGIAICYDLAAPHRYGTDIPTVTKRGRVKINTRDEDGRCIMCGVSEAVMHETTCPRASEPQYFLDGKEVQPAYVAITLKASDALECYACNRTDGHDDDCPIKVLGEITRQPLEQPRRTIRHLRDLNNAGMIIQADDKTVTFEDGTVLARDEYELLLGSERGCSLRIDLPPSHSMQAREWKPGDSVVLPLIGEAKVKRITDDADSVTIPLTFERLTVEACSLCERTDGKHEAWCVDPSQIEPLASDVLDFIDPKHIIRQIRQFLGLAPKKRAPTEDDLGVHRAIAAMQKPGRANEL